MTDTIESLRDRVAELEEALKPFAVLAKYDGVQHRSPGEIVQVRLHCATIRRAASLLSAPPPASEPESLHVHETCKENAVSFASEPDAGEVERVARILFDADHPAISQQDRDWLWTDDEGTPERYEILARAALSAMRPAIDREKVEEIRRAYDEWRGADTLCGLLADPEDEGSPKERQEAAEHAAWAWDQAAGKFMLYGDALLAMIGGLGRDDTP